MKKRPSQISGMLTAAALLLLSAPFAQAGTVTVQPPNVTYPPAVAPLYPTGIGFNPVVDYTKPNFAQSPNIRKFVDSLPGLGAANKNNLGQYIPVATPDTQSFDGADYYEIGLKQYSQQMSSDLPPTMLRGYYQKNGGDGASQYLGPAIIAHRDRPVRLKFYNELGLGTAGDLPLPLDPGVMGAGMGPMPGMMYGQNRSDVHLHGGLTPWISDGTPHQWVTPANDPMAAAGGPDYQKGASFQNVPDMITPSTVNGVPVPCAASGKGVGCFTPAQNDGIGTYYYPNAQSSRLMFYHDHAYGTTRLNVYAGMAAPYLLVDPVEEELLTGGQVTAANPLGIQILPDQSGFDTTGVYRYGVPLVIQDKAFVNEANTLSQAARDAFPAPETGYVHTAATLDTDPLWQYWVPGVGGGNLWFPHEYMPVENMFSPTGNTDNGRYDYAPFMNPPMVPNNLTLPSPTIVPETFVDTAVVNGTAYPYVELPPDAIRFRLLNASNDRTLNLQVYKADPLRINVTNGGTGYSQNTQVTVSGNAGTATATAIVSPGTITSIDVAGASHYLYPPTVTLTGGGGTCSSVTASIPSNTSGALEVSANGCTGYTSAPTVTITGGGGGTYTSATANIIPPGVITAIVVNSASGYRSDQPAPTVTITDLNNTGTGAQAVAVVNTEVKMVDAVRNAAYPSWPTDGRDGGVPDPTTAGPPWIQIGNEAGLLAQAITWPQQPIDYEYTRQNIPFAGVTSHTLLLMPAMRADVILDLRGYKDGDTLIVYNDAPAPMPGFWAIDDYYTDDPDQTGVGGAPTTPAGFGPNTRTIMQIRIKGTKSSTFDFNLANLQTTLPKAFAASQDKPLVPQQVYNDAYPGFASFDAYAQNYYDTLNLSGTALPLTKIRTVAPGNNYATPPTVTITGGGGTGAKATAGLNPCGGVTLLTAGSGYTSPPTVTIGKPGGGGVQATAVATIAGGIVTSIAMDEPGSNYSTTKAASCTITGGGGTGATCSTFVSTAGTVGSITITVPGTGYTSQPYVYLTGGGGMGATAVALLNGSKIFTGKNITEGFDPDYGRMDVRLGSTPSPLTPNIGNGPVIGVARYIDPPTDFMNDGETILWRIAHLGVDSHSLHFHLFNLQVVNRVDVSNVVKPPYPDELGWRETIRTNPGEDIIVAIQPKSMPLPFPIPDSNRLLDVTNPVNVNTNFLPIAPPVGVAAVPQITNVVTNFGWEYVWHCHLLGHEENDMMRPLSLVTAPAASVAPATLTFAQTMVGSTSAAQTVTVSNAAAATQPLYLGAASITGTNSTEFAVASTTCGPFVPPGTSCSYQITFSPAGGGTRTATLSIASTDTTKPTLNVALTGTGAVPPVAPANLNATPASPTSIALSWTDLSNNETSFTVWRSTDNVTFTQVFTMARTGTATTGTGGTVTWTDTGRTGGIQYYYYVVAVNAAGPSGPSNTATATIPSLMPASNLTATIASATSIALSWRDNSNNETGFQIWRQVNGGGFALLTTIGRTGTATTGFGGTVTSTDATVTAGNIYDYYVVAVNGGGSATASNTATVNFSVAAPTNLALVSIVNINGNSANVNLRWTNNNNQTGFVLQRSTTLGFSAGTTTTITGIAANATTYTDRVSRKATYYYRLQAVNGALPSAYTSTLTVPVP